MKITPVNTAFGAKIAYNKNIEAGFDIADKFASGSDKKELDCAKTFIDNLHKISADKSTDILEITSNSGFLNSALDGHSCISAVNQYASGLKKKAPETYLDSLKSRLEAVLELAEILKDDYSAALKHELKELRQNIKEASN